ncbi:MAG: tRNA pseudouridine(55) synthase TruB [Cyanobacteria bacterium RM1_2_2]|nr:tRNA pseudouridine(55) synthase TruB [Cyanobacteria bacterium RM1_2_2]
MQGFLNLNKPAGLTSHDCVARLRRLLKTKRIGHGGTLDPAATGVLPIAVGRATRLLQYLSHEKAYCATIRFGITTTTDDLEGDILTQAAAPQLALDLIQQKLPQFQGTIQQIPPSFSAIQVGGKRLYELARAGEAVEAPVRTVEIHQIEIVNWQPGDFPELTVNIACGTGTYIRSIARDLGAALGTGATLAALSRTASSGFLRQDSLTLETVAAQLEAKTLTLTPPEMALQHLPHLTLTDLPAKRWQQGQRIDWQEITDPSPSLSPTSYQIQQANGQFLGIGQIIETEVSRALIPKLVWQEAE